MAIGKWRGCKAKRRGRWVLDFDDQFGRRCWETLDLEATDANEAEAEVRLRLRRREVEDGTYQSKREQEARTKVRPTTKFQELVDHFLENHDVSEFTRAAYRGMIDLISCPSLATSG